MGGIAREQGTKERGHPARESDNASRGQDARAPLYYTSLRHVDRAFRIAVEQRVVKFDDVRLRTYENLVENPQKSRIGRIVGPQGEDAAGLKMGRETAQSFRLVERRVARVQEIAGRMIDVQQPGVKPPPRLFGIEAVLRGDVQSAKRTIQECGEYRLWGSMR